MNLANRTANRTDSPEEIRAVSISSASEQFMKFVCMIKTLRGMHRLTLFSLEKKVGYIIMSITFFAENDNEGGYRWTGLLYGSP